MIKENKLIVVVGANGKQGRSVIKSLRAKGYKIRALVRDRVKASKLFKDKEIEFFIGNLEDRKSLRGLFDQAYGLFFILPYVKNALSLGNNLIEEVKDSELNHIIFSSVGGVERNFKVDHFEHKRIMEIELKKLNKPFTILRPVGFMDNFVENFIVGRYLTSMLKLYLPSKDVFQLIAVEDIGKFVSIVFENLDVYNGIELEIAGDEISLDELVYQVSKILGENISPYYIPRFMKFFLTKEMKQMLMFYVEDGWKADIPLLKTIHPSLYSLETWLLHYKFEKSRDEIRRIIL